MKNSKRKAFKKIKTLEDACKVMGINPKRIRFGKIGRPKKSVRAYKHLSIIAQAVNKGTKLDLPVPHLDYKTKFYKDKKVIANNGHPKILFPSNGITKHMAKHFGDLYGEMMSL